MKPLLLEANWYKQNISFYGISSILQQSNIEWTMLFEDLLYPNYIKLINMNYMHYV